MSVLACNLQTAGLNDQQELRKAAFKLVYGWIISPALWAQSLTRSIWRQKLNKFEWGLDEPDYYWKRRRGCEKPYLASRYGPPPNYCLYNDMQTDPFSYTWTLSITSKSSVATLPDTKRRKLAHD